MEKKKVSVETVVRTIVLVVTLLNQVLTMLGKNRCPLQRTSCTLCSRLPPP